MKDLPFAKQPRIPTKKKPATVAEREYMERVHALGCTVTGYKDQPYTPKQYQLVNVHHDTRGGAYRNHYKTIPVLARLHLQQEGNRDSFHGNEKGWQKKHGSIKFHLIKTYEKLLNNGGLPGPAMKIYRELKEAQG